MSNILLPHILSEYNLTDQEVIKSLNLPLSGNYTVFAYSSKIEGLGGYGSDIDIYIITEIPINRPISMFKINNLMFDVECWSQEQLYNLIKNEKTQEDLKLLHRLSISHIMHNIDYAKTVLSHINILEIKKICIDNYLRFARAELDDAIKQLKSKNNACSLVCVRNSIEYAISAFCAMNGFSNINKKWNAKILIDNEGFGNTYLLSNYLEIQVFSNITKENVESHISKSIEFVNYIISQCLFPDFE